MPSSYSTDLKLELMVTGENAGTWGTKTNTNLNLLQQAIAGYQEVSIAGGAQTTALTMDNAAISNARNAVIKFTGTITGNQIVTIPNGIEKTYTIFNGTTGAFTVEFKTASGTGPTFSTTDKGIKLVYSDGTNVVDILTGPLSAVTIGGNLSVDGGTIKLDGNYPVGTSNVALGDGALDDAGLTGCQNTAVGSCALTANTTACCNTAVGDLALNLTTTGNSNTAVGATALQCNTTGLNNTAIGRSSLLKNTTGCNNTALGIVASLCNTTGICNTAIGHSANRLNETGCNNVAVGYEALCLNTVSNNTAVGHQALLCNTTGCQNTAVGVSAGSCITTGVSNTIVGAYTGCTTDLDIRTKTLFTVLSTGNGEPVFVTKTIGGATNNTSYRLMKIRHGLGYLYSSGTIAAAGNVAVNVNSAGGNGSIGILAAVTYPSDASSGFDSTFMQAHNHGGGYNNYGTALLYTTVCSITIVNSGGVITITNGSVKEIKYQFRYINLGAGELTLAAE